MYEVVGFGFLPNPDYTSGETQISTLVNAGRNTEAIVIAQKLGRDQAKSSLQWSVLQKDLWESMLAFWDTNFFFNLRFYLPSHGTWVTRTCYIGDRTSKPWDIDSNGVPTAYRDCQASIVDTGEPL
jgi:hypothetical protein